MNPSDDDRTRLGADPLWFKDAVIYEIPVRAFFDSDGDGLGDFRGLISKLDYVRDLGVTAIWLLPFYPSPHRDGGYDISDYRHVHPPYGELADFRQFLREAHRRGLRVITELVINHTSSDHPWFQRARRSPPGSKYRDYYVWSETPERYPGVRVIFQDFEASNWTWDPIAHAYYWHRFYHHQPDLNFDSPAVRREILRLLDYWLEMGVDGLRLDAIPYLFEREGTNCENLSETHAYLKELRAHVERNYADRMFLAEANQWPEDASAYFGDGDECHMNFHFPLMPRMFMAVQLESSFPILDILAQTPKIPDACQWAVFLRNHDELTLEMVTDEDRDYMYRVYAEDPQMRVNLGIRRRLAPLMGERGRIELMMALLFSMPGTPVLYYGDEIGMGDNVYLGDRDAVRTPMQWSGDRNAGFSSANPQRLFLPTVIDPEYHYMAINVEAQHRNASSLLWWTRRMLALRRRYAAFGRGDLAFVPVDNGKVLAFVRTWNWQRLLVVVNLSRTPQHASLDLSAHEGLTPIELLGQNPWPAIDDTPYVVTLGPYGFYWFSLESTTTAARSDADELPSLGAIASLESLAGTAVRDALEEALAGWIPQRRWFRSKAGRRKEVRLVDEVRVELPTGPALVLTVRVVDVDGHTDTYVVPVSWVEGDEAERICRERPDAVIARLELTGRSRGLLVDAMQDRTFAIALLDGLLTRRPERRSRDGVRLQFTATRGLAARLRDRDLTPRLGALDQSNHSVVYGESLILKLLRVIEPGTHPEEEVGRVLTEDLGFPHAPRLEGTIALQRSAGNGLLVGVVHEFVPSQGDAWTMTLDALDQYTERARASGFLPPARTARVVARTREGVSPEFAELIGPYLTLARQLGERTAELHLALSASNDVAFTPEPLTTLVQRSMYQSARTSLLKTLARLGAHVDRLEPRSAGFAREVIAREAEIDARLKAVFRHRIASVRTRVHGDLHLGQVLYTARDFVFIDFEGEPTRSLGERRLKRSPLRDVAGLLRSLRYACGALTRTGRLGDEDRDTLRPWLDAWGDQTTATLLGAWLDRVAGTGLAPEDPDDLAILLDYHLIEKCVYEIAYELDNRPDWLAIPLRGLLSLLDT